MNAHPDAQYQFAVEVVETLRGAGYTAFWAGGCVRDLLLGVPCKDYDVATSAVPEEVQQLFGARKTLSVGASFGVIIVKGGRKRGMVEVATFRTDAGYSDGRRPDAVHYSSPQEDAQRRDFTINGMFYDPVRTEVIDYVSGRADLDRRIVRAIGDPRARMAEDKLRMLRAVRFAATLDFELDPETASAVRQMASEIQVVSAERIAQELKRMLASDYRARAMRLFEELGLLTVVFPEFLQTPGAERQLAWNLTLSVLARLTGDSFELGMAALLLHVYDRTRRESGSPAGSGEDPITTITRRLKLSNHEREAVAEILSLAAQTQSLASRSLAARKRLLASPHAANALDLATAWATASEDSEWLEQVEDLERYRSEHSVVQIDPPPLLSGQDLLKLGCQPGKAMGRILAMIRDEQLNEQIVDQTAAINRARELIVDRDQAADLERGE